MIGGLMRWFNSGAQESSSTNPSGSHEGAAAGRTPMHCVDVTLDYSLYHLCDYDPISGVVLCVGNNVPVVVVTRGKRRAVLPTPTSVHWIGCHIFTGTSSVLLLSPERILLLDYMSQGDSSALSQRRQSNACFTHLYVPQGLTWGAVGTQDGTVMYWKIKKTGTVPSLVWLALTTDTLEFCRPFLPSQPDTRKLCGCVIAMNSSPVNPNTFLAVIVGAPGVCKWYVDENRLSRFFSLPTALADRGISTCSYTPSATFIVATTFDVSIAFIWAENGKMNTDRSVEITWAVETGCLPSSQAQTLLDNVAFFPPNGMAIARATYAASSAHTNKKSLFHLLVHSPNNVVELVLDVKEKSIVQRVDVLSHITAAQSRKGYDEGDAPGALTVQCVAPCFRSGYWFSERTTSDLSSLLVTCDGVGPLLVLRSRSKRGVDCVAALKDVMPESFPWDEMILTAPPPEVMKTMWRDALAKPDPADPWPAILCATKCCDSKDGNDDTTRELWDEALVGVVPYRRSGAVCLFPSTNECIAFSPDVTEQNMVVMDCPSVTSSSVIVLLDKVLPEFPQRSEFILRVLTSEEEVSVYVLWFTPQQVECLLTVSREQLCPTEAAGCSGDSERCGEAEVVGRVAKLVDCRIEQSADSHTKFRLVRGGMSILLQLYNGDLVLVGLGGGRRGGEETPEMVRYPSGLFPAGTTVTSFDTAWLSGGAAHKGGDSFLALFCTLSDDRGLILWDMSRMRMVGYYRKAPGGKCEYSNVMTCTKTSYAATTTSYIDVLEITVCANEGANRRAASEEVVPCENGIVFRNIFGVAFSAVEIRWGSDGNDGFYGKFNGDNEWAVLSPPDVISLRLTARIVEGKLVLEAETGHSMETAVPLSSRFARADAVGNINCVLHKVAKSGEHEQSGGTAPCNCNAVVLWNDRKVHVFHSEQFLSGENIPQPVGVCHVDPVCTVEQVDVCQGLQLIVVIIRDANKWRWLSIMDLVSGENLLDKHAILRFTDDDNVRLHVLLKEDELHVYMVSVSGTLAHLIVSPKGIERVLPQSYFKGNRCSPVPESFRSYLTLFPPPRSANKDQGLLKRLTAPSWEEVAAKIEVKVLTHEMDGPPRGNSTETPSSSGSRPAPLSEVGAQESKRYKELKSIAARENVSVMQALQIMRENEAKVHERGEKISEIANKSRELEQETATFEKLARKLKERQNSWM